MNRVLSSIRIPSRDEEPASRLQQLVRQRRRIARQHVHLDAWLSPHLWNAATGIAFLAEIPACVANPGLDAERAARAIRALGSFVLGATRDETQGCAHGPSSLEPLTQAELEALSLQEAPARRSFTPDQFGPTFGLSLDVPLFGVDLPRC